MSLGWRLLKKFGLILGLRLKSETSTIADFGHECCTLTTIVKAIRSEPESRRKWLLKIMAENARRSALHQKYQLRQRGDEPTELYSPFFISQKMHYVHLNPIRAGWVDRPEHFRYSSASNYKMGCGLLEIDHIVF